MHACVYRCVCSFGGLIGWAGMIVFVQVKKTTLIDVVSLISCLLSTAFLLLLEELQRGEAVYKNTSQHFHEIWSVYTEGNLCFCCKMTALSDTFQAGA